MERTVVAWNRSRIDLGSDEILTQILDRGDLAAWRELYRLAAADGRLRQRLLGVIQRAPLPFPSYWRAVLAGLGEPIDWTAPLPGDPGVA